MGVLPTKVMYGTNYPKIFPTFLLIFESGYPYKEFSKLGRNYTREKLKFARVFTGFIVLLFSIINPRVIENSFRLFNVVIKLNATDNECNFLRDLFR